MDVLTNLIAGSLPAPWDTVFLFVIGAIVAFAGGRGLRWLLDQSDIEGWRASLDEKTQVMDKEIRRWFADSVTPSLQGMAKGIGVLVTVGLSRWDRSTGVWNKYIEPYIIILWDMIIGVIQAGVRLLLTTIQAGLNAMIEAIHKGFQQGLESDNGTTDNDLKIDAQTINAKEIQMAQMEKSGIHQLTIKGQIQDYEFKG